MTRALSDFSRMTLSDLSRITGSKPRAVQIWAESGVLYADEETERAGSGTHRTFGAQEVMIACITAAVASSGCPIGRLLKISHALRAIYLKNEGVQRCVQLAVQNTSRVFLFIEADGRMLFLSERDNGPIDFFEFTTNMSDHQRAATIVFLNGAFAGMRS